ncbi:MAG TPA: hypothetical protein VGH33_00620 [Isosphaeraceae bacterium]|jgi:hypothetical protein
MADKHHETQEQSIKARKHQLFEPDAPAFEVGSGRSFKDFVRTTPAAPMSGLTRAALWAAGVVVAVVLVGALLKTFHRPPQAGPRPARKAAGVELPDRRDALVNVLRNGPGRLQPGAGDSIVKDCTGPRQSSPSTKVSV